MGISSETAPIVTDSRKLRQIVQNLISNAIKFTDHGKVTVSVQTVSGSPNLPLFDSERNGQNGLDQWLEIKVRDTGRGIPTDKLNAIFGKFYQWTLPKPAFAAASVWDFTSPRSSPSCSTVK